MRRDLLLTGDFNIHFEKNSCCEMNRFKTMLSDHNLTQLVNCPTHEKGHTLDLFIVRTGSCIFSLEGVQDLGLSDHFAVLGNLAFRRPCQAKRSVSSCNLRAINTANFHSDIVDFFFFYWLPHDYATTVGCSHI